MITLVFGPRIGQSLSDRVHLIGDFELRDVPAYISGQVLRAEAHGSDVEGIPVAKAPGIGLHQVHRRFQSIVTGDLQKDGSDDILFVREHEREVLAIMKQLHMSS